MNLKKDEEKKFNESYEKFKKIGELLTDKNKNNDSIITELNEDYKDYFKKIKEKLSNDDEEAAKFIIDLKNYYKLDNKDLINELDIFFKSKKYELDINSIIFFFEYKFEKDDWNKKLPPKDFMNKWEESFQNIKEDLDRLNKNGIYIYNDIKKYNRFFKCLYEKEEAIDFLFSKSSNDIIKLKEKIQPTDTTIKIKDIVDTSRCVEIIDKMKKTEGNQGKFEYITTLETEIEQFENYSKVYPSIIELYTDDDISDNVYDKVVNIITEASFNIEQDKEKFLYFDKTKNKYCETSMVELIHLKNQIHIKNDKGNYEDKIIKEKCEILIFFKDKISDLEVLNSYMKILRRKGSSLPIQISIKIKIKNKIPSIEYHLDKYKKEFNEIREFLFDAKNSYITQLESIYKEKFNLRFLYGKQFRSIMKHIEQNYKIEPFLRYILNNTNNEITINEGDKKITRNVTDYINNKQYEIYSRNSLDGISSYITSLFNNNNKQLEKHYESMKITSKGFKGLFLYDCGNSSKEEYIITLFWDKIKDLPIAQNVLITNKETSFEEVQAFFHRAILCNYNTLFTVEINDSFSDFLQNKMNSYIDNLLTLKNDDYNQQKKENIDKKSTDIYLDSFIVFVYDSKNKKVMPFIKEIEKFTNKEEEKENQKKIPLFRNNTAHSMVIKNGRKDIYKYKYKDTYLKNIKVITSDICGLGKSTEIKKKINTISKIYFHFSLGGILTKSLIFEKLDKLIKEIANEIKTGNKKYSDIAIHLDLTESKETSIINEFFFSFLITRFYTNNENIIYIPKDIFIYIEVPNCFKDYLSKFSILSIFEKENISFDNMPQINYPENIVKYFTKMLDYKTNQEIQKFVQSHIGGGELKSKFSYHQIDIFVKLFISQYSKFKSKLKFMDENKNDVTKICIEEFAKSTQYFINNGFAKLLTGTIKIGKKNIIKILSKVYENDYNKMEYDAPLIFTFKKGDKMLYDKLVIPKKDSKKYKNSIDYLKKLVEILNLPSKPEELQALIQAKNNNYVITNDNFKKMVILIYRIFANVPVIIMGDTGCGKTSLINILNQIVNGGKTKIDYTDKSTGIKKIIFTIHIINIHPGISDTTLCEHMELANKEAEELKKYGKQLWVFFDEMNTCLSLTLLTEIFINREFNGNKVNENIRLIGACNPYRKRRKDKEKCGLSMSDDNDNELVYLVQPFPQSLLYYVYSFGSIDDIDEKKYIFSILEKSFTESEKHLHEVTTDAISQCHIYLRSKFDPSVVSLREIARFTKCLEFFKEYFKIKNEFLGKRNNENNNKLRSIICSIYLCYYIRLTNQDLRFNFEAKLRQILINLINTNATSEEQGKDLIEQINNEEFKLEIETSSPPEKIKFFSDFLKNEQNFLIEQIELDKGIGKNVLLKENVFLLFLAVVTNIPLIIIGKPGTGKSLSAQLICKSMKGKYSKNKFFKKYPRIIQIYFQGSESTQPEDIQRLFRKAESKSNSVRAKLEEKSNNRLFPIIMVLFDELGLAERSESNPLKVLHEKLEYTGKKEGVSFVGISNYSLDAAKVNRALVLSVPDLDERIDDLNETAKNIVASISERIQSDDIFRIISRTYFNYKKIIKTIKDLVVYKKYIYEKKFEAENNSKTENLEDSNDDYSESDSDSKATSIDQQQKNVNKDDKNQVKTNNKRQFEYIKQDKIFIDIKKKEKKIKIDFHGNRDFYNLIKGIAIELKSGDITDDDKVSIVIKYIERNFGGIEYEIDIDLDSPLEDTKNDIELIKNILADYNYEENKKAYIPLSSVFLFKKLYKIQCESNDPNSKLLIAKEKLNDYNLNKCINDNIRDINSRYLLLEIEKALTNLIIQNIKLHNPSKNDEDIIIYDGSPFVDDNNKDYRFKIINKIQEDAKEDRLIIIENLNQIHPFLFDLYNMNYIIKNDKKLVRICLENFNEQLTEVNERFRVIILIDKRILNKCNIAFLNRLEKMNLSFEKLLDKDTKRISDNFLNEIKLLKSIEKYKNINYSLKDLLINCNEEDIRALIYFFSKELKKDETEENEEQKDKIIDEESIKKKVLSKIYKILPQDIICILQEKNIIRNYYKENEIYYNYKDYINEGNIKDYKISIIYTFTGLANIVEGLNKGMNFMASEIRSEEGLRTLIEEIKNKNEKNYIKEYNITIDFEESNSKKIKFISNFIKRYFKDDKYHYIFIIHISRNFTKNNMSKSLPDNKNSQNQSKKINSIPDIDNLINQVFIDNLNGSNIIKFKEMINENIVKLLNEKKDELELNKEFENTLINTINKELNDRGSDEKIIKDYIEAIVKFLNDETEIKEKIIEVIHKLIGNETNCKSIIENLYKSSNINKYTVDVSSCLIQYIKDNIFNNKIKEILLKLEDNNILTTLYQLQVNNFQGIDRSSVKNIVIKYLDEIAKDRNNIVNISPKFLYNYTVPGLYNFYSDISNYINKNIKSNYYNNEKKLRFGKKIDDKDIIKFHETEDSLINNVNKYIEDNKFIYGILNKVSLNLIFNDYITYFLQNHKINDEIYKKDDVYHKILELLLRLRFKSDNNEKNMSIFLMKIIWIESNINYILNIFKIIDFSKNILEKDTLYKNIESLNNKNKIKYITNKDRNPVHTKEVNECYYIILACICYCITSEEIELSLSLTNKNIIDINQYLYNIREINKILQSLDNDLNIYLNEMYIIDELIKIIEIFFKRNNIEKINTLKNLLRKNVLIIQAYFNENDNNNDNDDNDKIIRIKLINELKDNFAEIYDNIFEDEIIEKDDKDFYDKLRYILLKEIMKISYSDYRYEIVKKILESNEMIKKSKDIFQIILKNYIKKDYKLNRNYILNGNDDIIKLLDNKINTNFVLSETLLYFFEKNSINYLGNIINSKKENIIEVNGKKKKEVIIIKLENEPLNILKDCYEFLKLYIYSPNKLDAKFLKEICKIFCLAYIKVYINTFIKSFEDEEGKQKFNDPKIIINTINEN